MAVVGGVSVFAACVSGLNLSTTEEKTLVYNGSNPYYFGVVMVGGMSAYAPFTLTGQMTTDDDTITGVKALGACNQFDIQGPPPLGSAGTFRVWCEMLPAFGSQTTTCTQHVYQFMAAFRPTVAGQSTCDLEFHYMHTGTGPDQIFTMTMVGSAAAPMLSIAAIPNNLPFGGVQINTSQSHPMMVKNTGMITATVTVASSNPSAPISISPTTAVTIPGNGGSAGYVVTCNPTAVGTYATDFAFTAMGSGSSASDVTHVTCDGINSALNITSPVQFDEAFLGTAPPEEPFVISTMGSTTIASITLDTMATANGVTFTTQPPSNYALTSSNPITLMLHYKADMPHMDQLGTITVKSSTEADRTIPVSGNALPADLGLNPVSKIDFGTVCLGDTSTKDLELYAADVKDFRLTGLDAPTNNQVFTVTGYSNLLLRGNHQNNLTVQVHAKPAMVGSASDSLTVHTEIPTEATTKVDLMVKSLASGVAPDMDMVHFGSLAKDQTSGGKDVVLTNCSGSSIDITGAHIEGANPLDFTIVKPNPIAGTLASTEQLTFTLVMTPHDRGERKGTLVIEYTGGTTQVALDGNGVGGIDTGGNVDRETYYGCSTGGGAPGIAPIAFALIVLRRRRR